MVRDDDSATAPATGGGGSTADLELTIEDVEKIGQDTSALTAKTQAALAMLADAKGSPGDFSSYGPAQALFAQHQAVVEVFEKTLSAMTTDIDDFGATIVQAARNHAQTDGDVLAALTAIGSKVTGSVTRSAHNDARNEGGYALLDADEQLDSDSEIDTYGEKHEEVLDPSINALRPQDEGHAGTGGAALDGNGPP
ncbi:hypothetical protein [Aeromicrobium stalagmiti]|uniref:hypothetical protein n=1 Tax=Aeromicrobium stalagmiti TaxID=2738988 RepID=UPI001567E6E3|nr:hypothetical protein [Aeromicrobium stalagmiti]NRQ48611.1 hypothetical protein [Aeromicrobium stalagmiti]